MEESSIFLVLFKGSFKDPRYCFLGFLGALVESRRIGSWKVDNKVKNGVFIMMY